MEQKEYGSIVLDRVKHTRISVSITLLISLLVGTYIGGVEGNRLYVDWHNEHVKTVAGQLIAAETKKFSEQITHAQTTADETSRKVDAVSEQIEGLKISAAINIVSSFQAELDRHERGLHTSEEWRIERDRLRRQLERAVQYRDCLMNRQPNCERLRGW